MLLKFATSLCSSTAHLRRKRPSTSNRVLRPHLESTIGLYLSLLLAVLVPTPALAGADAPPFNYENLGPHFVVSPGLGFGSAYRDLLFKEKVIARLGVTATYRGLSLSGFTEQRSGAEAARVSELAVTYSHKLPLIDAHVGLVHWDLTGPLQFASTDLRLVMSSNTLSRTKVVVSLDKRFSGHGRTAGLEVSHLLWQRGANQIDVRVSGTDWKHNQLDGHGYSARLIARRTTGEATALHYHVGYVSSRAEGPLFAMKNAALVAGLNYVWEFR